MNDIGITKRPLTGRRPGFEGTFLSRSVMVVLAAAPLLGCGDGSTPEFEWGENESALSTRAASAVANVSGTATHLARPPASVLPGRFEGPSISVFDELQDVELRRPLIFDTVYQGGPSDRTEDFSELRPGLIRAGTCVSSTLIRYDPENFNGAAGAVRFKRSILGIMVRPAQLDASNVLGHPDTEYPGRAGSDECNVGSATCGLELQNQDSFTLQGSLIHVTLDALDPGDYIRVITEGFGPACAAARGRDSTD